MRPKPKPGKRYRLVIAPIKKVHLVPGYVILCPDSAHLSPVTLSHLQPKYYDKLLSLHITAAQKNGGCLKGLDGGVGVFVV